MCSQSKISELDEQMSDIDNTMQRYMDAHIKRLDDKIDQLLIDTKQIKVDLAEKFAEVRTEQKVCRRHCEENCENFAERLAALERQSIANEAARQIMEKLDKQDLDREDLMAQKKQWFWMKLGAFITLMMILSNWFIYAIDKAWK